MTSLTIVGAEEKVSFSKTIVVLALPFFALGSNEEIAPFVVAEKANILSPYFEKLVRRGEFGI